MARPRFAALLIACFLLETASPFSLARAQAQVDASYVLGSLDMVEVNVTGLPELTTRTRIGEDDTIILPLIGAVPVGGLTARQAEETIGRRLVVGGFVNNPAVRLDLVEVQSRKVSVLGEVNAQGMIALDRSYSVAELIARAGGLGPNAADAAVIVRQTPNGGTVRLPIDLGPRADGTPIGLTTRVRPGDVVIVPKAPTVSIVGAVNRAGSYRLSPNMSVQQALALAGDVARIGTRSGLKIRRQKGAAIELIKARLDDPVQPGDVIVVRERIF